MRLMEDPAMLYLAMVLAVECKDPKPICCSPIESTLCN